MNFIEPFRVVPVTQFRKRKNWKMYLFLVLDFTVSNAILRINLSCHFCCKRKFLTGLAQALGGGGDYMPVVFMQCWIFKVLEIRKASKGQDHLE